METLSGGRSTGIYRQGETVVRPIQEWSATVHCLLRYLHQQGFHACPEVIGMDTGSEVLSFVEGDTYNYPLEGAIASEEALISAARLLRQLHDVSQGFLNNVNLAETVWMLPAREPAEVICHGDFTPYNVALNGNEVVGVFDFDTAHPAPRLWDIAYSVYCWSPFKTDPIDKMGTLNTQIARARLFCDSYCVSNSDRQKLVTEIITRLQSLVTFMLAQADTGDEQFAQHIAEGHHAGYLADIDYLSLNENKIIEGIC
ncbi:aminoglycoside phosphotransferase family protein [Photobacterium sp. 2_MG-2023]|uniref:aminoglycoside phosphotransferase family protein n=1 Tax=Photobacterium sp. 2_MG-2023 TaxID=3062663 RepID=UPI0026E3D547|nr:aminoglycoside phosphotransferase family protein [Photobacterium sp. 2_MG-2023]MDO6580239.1 aminoglycoside phosphotransferase family protein [Photobacterium sp. 2_MG-2023]